MQIGSYFFEIPKTIPALNATSFYYVAFVFIAFCLSRVFKSILRPIILLVANIAFLYTFGLTNLHVALIAALATYIFGIFLGKFKNKILLLLYVAVEVLFLVCYKYDFLRNISLVMPLGISYYTFKNISYLVDIYKDKVKTIYNPIYFLDYSLFFPCIVAGPINRSNEFVEELKAHNEFDYKDAKNGGIQLLLGIFEKVVICAYIANISNLLLDNPEIVGFNALLGVVLYAFNIYLDFDSYSNIAIGSARLFGIHLGKNFNSPYLGKSLKDFWSRWHISLTSWLKDYIYIPLGGSKKGVVIKYLNILVVFLVSGIWHGNTLNFIIWGLLNAVIRIIEDPIDTLLDKKAKIIKPIKWLIDIIRIIFNFCLVNFLWLFFKYQSIAEVIEVINRIKISGALDLTLIELTHNQIIWLQVLLVVVIVLDILRNYFDMLDVLAHQFFIFRWAFYIVLIFMFLIFGVYGGSYNPADFIYQGF